jgi:hypothetical protein
MSMVVEVLGGVKKDLVEVFIESWITNTAGGFQQNSFASFVPTSQDEPIKRIEETKYTNISDMNSFYAIVDENAIHGVT